MTSKFTLTTLFFLITIGNLYSQVTQDWVARYNGQAHFYNEANSITVDKSGNIYVTGKSEAIYLKSDYATIKYNPAGVIQWENKFNGLKDSIDIPYSIVLDHNNNVYVTGKSYGNGTDYDITTIKYNPSGVQQWTQRYNSNFNGSDVGRYIAVDNLNNVYVTGESNQDIVTIKYNSNGIIQWIKSYNGPGNGTDSPNSMKIDNKGNVYITGQSVGNGSDLDYVTIKYNTSGIQQWVQRYNGTYNSEDQSNSLDVDFSGNVYITGESYYNNRLSCITIKYNPSGIQQWLDIFNDTLNYSKGVNIKTDLTGNIFVALESFFFSPGIDFVVVKYNPAGIQQWIAHNNASYIDSPGFMNIDIYGNIYVAGTSRIFQFHYDYLTVKFDNNGVLQWTKRYDAHPELNIEYDGLNGLTLDTSGNVYVTGTSQGFVSQADFCTIKYSQPIGIQPISSEIPSQFSLSQNYPNPFNPTTKIRFALPLSPKGEGLGVRLKIYDILGREVETLVNEQLKPGTYEVTWDASDYSSGVYFYSVQAGNYKETKKMILEK